MLYGSLGMRYRSRTEIITQILEIVNEGSSDAYSGATQTKIMYKAFLSYAQLKEYLTVLTKNDLLRYDSHTHRFKATEKGLSLLEAYDQIEQLMKDRRT
jgi:predicted transcriptional regulator